MSKYIDADLLRKEIEKERKSIEGLFIEGDNHFYDGQDDAYNHTLALIGSLQQEQQEVDLEKVVMIDNVIMNMTAEGYNNGYKTRPFYEEVLRRLNARKK